MQAMRKFRYPAISLLFFFLIFTPFAPRNTPAHHTSSISYIFQEVGKKKIENMEIELNAMPPRLIKQENTPKSMEHAHRLLSRFTHRFEMRIKDTKDRSPLSKKLEVQLKFTQNEWEKTFTLKRFRKDKQEIYGANVQLGEKGPYAITAVISGLAPHPVRTRFSFDFDPESVKDVMKDLEKILANLGRETLTLGLNGKFIPRQKERQINQLSEKFKFFVPWISNLREGEAQELYDDLTRKLLDLAETIEINALKPDYDRLAGNLAAARTLCSECHRIFQEADSTGKPVRLPAPSPAR